MPSFNLTGYSQADRLACVAKLDEAQDSFNFRRVLLIQPAGVAGCSIAAGSHDPEHSRWEDNLPFERTKCRVSARSGTRTTSAAIFLKAYRAMHLQNEELAALIGFSSASRPALDGVHLRRDDRLRLRRWGLELDRFADLTVYDQVLSRVGFYRLLPRLFTLLHRRITRR